MKTRNIVYVALFAALTAVGAFIRVPIPFVPFTLQFFFCAMSGMLLGSRLGMMSQLVYVLVGLCGIPVFTEGGGPSYILKPTFGYLIGFILCAYVTGWLVERMEKPRLLKFYLATLAGMSLVYLIGVPYLYLIYNFYLNSAKSAEWAVYWGFAAFIGPDLVLSYLVALLGVKLLPALRDSGLGHISKLRADEKKK